MVSRRVLAVPLAALLAVVPCGCSGGSKLVKVTGTVTLDGAPLPEATLNFVPVSAGAERARGYTGPNGSFELLALPGEYKVLISKVVSAAGKGKSVRGPGNRVEIKGPTKDALPSAYNTEAQTPFQCVVPPGKELVFDVKSKGP
jgi:hypothetical protein